MCLNTRLWWVKKHRSPQMPTPNNPLPLFKEQYQVTFCYAACLLKCSNFCLHANYGTLTTSHSVLKTKELKILINSYKNQQSSSWTSATAGLPWTKPQWRRKVLRREHLQFLCAFTLNSSKIRRKTSDNRGQNAKVEQEVTAEHLQHQIASFYFQQSACRSTK